MLDRIAAFIEPTIDAEAPSPLSWRPTDLF